MKMKAYGEMLKKQPNRKGIPFFDQKKKISALLQIDV